MKKVHSTAELGELEKASVVTVGNFDGVHIGHKEILSVAKKLAAKNNAGLLVMTFEPHPVSVLSPEKELGILSPPPLKEKLLDEAGADCWLTIKPQADILSLSAPDFIEKFITEPIAPSAMVEGEDFYFGANRSGDVQLLEHLGSVNGFDVVVVPAKEIELSQIVRVSSTVIRYMLESGSVADAATALGRPYKLIGRVISGRGKGRQIGFPTLNMEKPNQLVPAEGVYAGYVAIADTFEQTCSEREQLPAVFSIGQARTFGDEHPLLIEAHLLNDIEFDPTGKYMAMDFIEHVRKQHKFASVEDLASQITKDCKTAGKILRN